MNDMTPEELEKRLANLRAPATPALDARIERMRISRIGVEQRHDSDLAARGKLVVNKVHRPHVIHPGRR